jgi:hypothetical protein
MFEFSLTERVEPAQRLTAAGESTAAIADHLASDGTRWRYSYRNSRGRPSIKRGFSTERAAGCDRDQRMGRVRQGAVYVSRMTFGESFPAGCGSGGATWLRTPGPTMTSAAASGASPTSASAD